jgi:hypothetical protein
MLYVELNQKSPLWLLQKEKKNVNNDNVQIYKYGQQKKWCTLLQTILLYFPSFILFIRVTLLDANWSENRYLCLVQPNLTSGGEKFSIGLPRVTEWWIGDKISSSKQRNSKLSLSSISAFLKEHFLRICCLL